MNLHNHGRTRYSGGLWILPAILLLHAAAPQAKAECCCELEEGCINTGVQDCRLNHLGQFRLNYVCVDPPGEEGPRCQKKPSGGNGCIAHGTSEPLVEVPAVLQLNFDAGQNFILAPSHPVAGIPFFGEELVLPVLGGQRTMHFEPTGDPNLIRVTMVDPNELIEPPFILDNHLIQMLEVRILFSEVYLRLDRVLNNLNGGIVLEHDLLIDNQPVTIMQQGEVLASFDTATGEWLEFVADGGFFFFNGDAHIVDAQSLRDHAGIELAIDLENAGGIEPRIGGVRRLAFQASEDLDLATVTPANVQVECQIVDLSLASVEPFLPDAFFVELNAPIADRDCCRFTFDGMVTVDGLALNDAYQVKALAGDVDFSGAVTGGDAALVKPHFGEIAGVDLAGPQWDVNADGGVTGGDFAQIKPRFGNQVKSCP